MPAHDPRVHVDLAHLAGLEARARGFDFLPRQPVGSALSGRRASRLRGRGLEFEEIRAYLPGDDVRAIDWKVTARTGAPHVRVTREERDRPALIVVDQRQAMFFGTVLNMKSVTAAEIAALAAWRILGAGDRVGGLVLSDASLAAVPAGRSRGTVLRLLDLVADGNGALGAEVPTSTEAAGRLDAALGQAARIVTHDWLVLVISDFDSAGAATLRILTGIAQSNDLVLALVHDPFAHEIPKRGRVVVGDGRLQVELDLTDTRVRRNLAGVGGDRLTRLLAWQERLDAAILPISAGEPTLPQLLRLFGAPPAAEAVMEPQEPDSLVGLIDQLWDIVEPAPVSMTPQTWAWAVVAALLLVAIAAGGLAWVRHRRATAWRRAALAELRTIAPALEAGEPGALARLQVLLRRVALATAPRAEVAGLTGADWAGYLAKTGDDFGPMGATLAAAPYRPGRVEEGRAALDAARAWIRRRHA